MKRATVGLILLTLVAAGLAATALSVAGTASRSRPAAWATLAFSRPETAGGGVYLVGRRGARLLARGGLEPAWSPDGRRVAYVAPGAGGVGDVFVRDADGRHRGRITHTDGVYEASPSWSPDGLRLAFERDGSIVVARADGSRARLLTRGLSPSWSPGGKRIAFERDGDLFLVPASGGRPVRLTVTTAAESAPSWAPDGRRLAYVSEEAGMRDIRVLDTRSRSAIPLTADPAFDSSPAFSADGRRIVFVSDRSGTEALWRVPAQGGAASPVGGPALAADPEPRPGPETPELLPDLDQQPPQDLDVRTKGRRHLLWFTSAADNVGLGPFIVDGRRRSAGRAMRANQRVRLANGSLRTYPEIGVWRYNASSDHSHWHLIHFQRYELRQADGSVVVRDRKSGFCIGDRYGVAADRVDGFVPRPVYRGLCSLYQPTARRVDGGTSVGYSDRYHSRLDGQNVNITRVPAGEYVLVNRANPQLLIRELRYENNAGSVRLRISRPKGRRAPPSVRVLKTCPDSDRCE
jgi:dipeptidyl aminopeptidase/acylaminoacyl peptidase